MPRAAEVIVRDVDDYPAENEAAVADARGSLPEMYAHYPYRGVFKLDGIGEAWVHVFSRLTADDLVADGWIRKDPA